MPKSHINEASVKKLSELARIRLNDEEVRSLLPDIQKIVDYVGLLDEVDTSDLSPYAHMPEQSIHTLRDDVPETAISQKELLENAPDHIGSMIRVPQVLTNTPSS